MQLLYGSCRKQHTENGPAVKLDGCTGALYLTTLFSGHKLGPSVLFEERDEGERTERQREREMPSDVVW